MPDTARRKFPGAAEAAFTADTLLNGKIRLRQPVAGYRAAIDPVFLAALAPTGSRTANSRTGWTI